MKELFLQIFDKLTDINKAVTSSFAEGLNESYFEILAVIEIFLILVIIFKMLTSFFSGSFRSHRKKDKGDTSRAGGFRRRFDRVSTDIDLDYRLEKEGEYKHGVCRDISVHGMKIEIENENPEIHQRVEFVLDGKKLKLKNDDRVKIGGFVVRVVEKGGKHSYDIGVEFYHLFRKQQEMIEAIIAKKKK